MSWVAIALLGAGASSTALAQNGGAQPLYDRMEQLEREITALQSQVQDGDYPESLQLAQVTLRDQQQQPASADTIGRLQVRMSELERLMQELTGQVEEANFRTERLNRRLEGLIDDLEFRLSRLESQAGLSAAPLTSGATAPSSGGGALLLTEPAASGGGSGEQPPQGVLGFLPSGPGAVGAEPGRAAAPPPSGLPPLGQSATQAQPQVSAAAPTARPSVALPEGSPEQQYSYAFNLLRQSDFQGAENAFSAFLDQHPTHELAGNSKYWLGETFYVRGNYERAAVVFLEGYQDYPRSSKGPDNLLKLGMAMGHLGQTAEACAAYQRLASDYPAASDDIKRRAAAERDRLACR